MPRSSPAITTLRRPVGAQGDRGVKIAGDERLAVARHANEPPADVRASGRWSALCRHGPRWSALLLLRTLVALCLGGAIMLAYALGAEIDPAEQRGAAFGWLTMGMQFGTAVSPLGAWTTLQAFSDGAG